MVKELDRYKATCYLYSSITIIILLPLWYLIYCASLRSFNTQQIRERSEYIRIHNPNHFNLTHSLLFNIIKEFTTSDASLEISVEKQEEAQQYIKNIAMHNINDIKYIAESPRNLVVIIVESLNSKDFCSASMPFTYGLTQDSTTIFISKVKDVVGVGRSMDGQITILSGLHPNTKNFTLAQKDHIYNFPSLIKSLKIKTDYHSMFSTMTDTTFWNQSIAAKAMDFGELYGAEIGSWIADKELFKGVINNLNNRDRERPIFYTIITGDSHGPFKPESQPPLHPLPDDLDMETRGYYMSLQRTDFEISKLISYLKSNDLYHNTTIVITADHSLDREKIVPLLIVNPFNNPNYRPKDIVSQISIYPTIMHAIGVVDTMYMGLTPSMLSPRIEGFGEKELLKIKDVSHSIIYGNYDKSIYPN